MSPDHDHSGPMTREEFTSFIREETGKAREEAAERVADTSITSVGCVDPLTKFGQWNPPGGVVFLCNEGLLEQFVVNRPGMAGELNTHYRCGYMFVEMGLTTLSAQKKAVENAKKVLTVLNKKYRTRFSIPNPEPQGSAAMYMTG